MLCIVSIADSPREAPPGHLFRHVKHGHNMQTPAVCGETVDLEKKGSLKLQLVHGDKQIQRNVYRWQGFSTPLCGLLHARQVNGDRILTVRQLAGASQQATAYIVSKGCLREPLTLSRSAQRNIASEPTFGLGAVSLCCSFALKLMCAHSVDAFRKHVLEQRVTRLAAVTV